MTDDRKTDKLSRMIKPPFKIPEIALAEQTPLVEGLVQTIVKQQAWIEELESEIRRLKKLKGKPQLKPSRMDAQTEKSSHDESGSTNKPGPTRSKTAQLNIHEENIIAPQELPANAHEEGWRFKGYDDFVVQDLNIEAHNIRFRLETWQSPDGQYLKGKLPALVDGHYGAQLKSDILYQYHNLRVTQPLLLEQLHDWGIDISAGQLNH